MVNAILCAVGHNLRLLLAWFRKLLWLSFRPDSTGTPETHTTKPFSATSYKIRRDASG